MDLGLGEGLLQRQKAAENVVHLAATAETEDHQDHTFAGIMWDVRTRKLPAEYIEISSVWLRGDLGPITVWSTPNSFQSKHQQEDEWKLHYKQVHQPSPRVLQEMRFDEPLRLEPGESCGMYAHSAMPGDEQIVYDNHRQSHQFSYRDMYIDILPGMAHLSDVPFSCEHQFMGWWGRPWRERREFVGRLSYGVRWLLWNPDVHTRMPEMFKKMVWSVLMSRSERANRSFLHYLEPDMIFYILNKVEWWESPAIMEELKKDSEEVPGFLASLLPSSLRGPPGRCITHTVHPSPGDVPAAAAAPPPPQEGPSRLRRAAASIQGLFRRWRGGGSGANDRGAGDGAVQL